MIEMSTKKMDQNLDMQEPATKRGLNKEIISDRHLLLHVTFRIKKVLQLCESIHEPSNFQRVEELNYAKEMNGVINVSKLIAVISQHENKCVAAHGQVVKIKHVNNHVQIKIY